MGDRKTDEWLTDPWPGRYAGGGVWEPSSCLEAAAFACGVAASVGAVLLILWL